MEKVQENKKRNANIELLRILSMLMVTTLHALGKSGLLISLGGDVPLNGWIAWIMEVLSICAVNVYMLITGYFLINSKFSVRRLIELVAQTLFYMIGLFFFFYLIGVVSAESLNVYFILQYVFPIHMDVYWFMTSYLVLYLVIPLLSEGVRALSEKQLRIMLICLLIYESVIKSVLPFRFTVDDRGYSFLWYLTIALLGAYFRLHGFGPLKNARLGLIAYFGGSLLALLEVFAIDQVNARTGHLNEIIHVSIEYNHLFVLIAAAGLFAALVNAKPVGEKVGKVACAISPYVLGVYLFQENLSIRYEWQKWFGLKDSVNDPIYLFLPRLLLAILAMFVLGILVDFLRSKLFKLFDRRGGK